MVIFNMHEITTNLSRKQGLIIFFISFLKASYSYKMFNRKLSSLFAVFLQTAIIKKKS